MTNLEKLQLYSLSSSIDKTVCKNLIWFNPLSANVQLTNRESRGHSSLAWFTWKVALFS